MPDHTLSSVRSAARLLKAFLTREERPGGRGGGPPALGVSELARRLDLGKSNVHRLLTTLVSEGLIERDPDTGGYRLGFVMFQLGEAARASLDLHVAAGPVLARLSEQTGETVLVAVLDRHEVLYVDRLDGANNLRLFAMTGDRAPAHCTSSGKVLLAHLPEPDLQAVLDQAELVALTPYTIVDPTQLRRDLAQVASRGWAETVNEREIGVASVAAPIRDRHGDVVAAISVGGPVTRLDSSSKRQYATAIVAAGEDVSRRLGWTAPVLEREA